MTIFKNMSMQHKQKSKLNVTFNFEEDRKITDRNVSKTHEKSVKTISNG